jgi:hypothetical protein
MFKWQKLGKVFDPTEANYGWWIEEFAQAPATLIFDDFVRVYFSCRPKPDERGQYVSYSGFVDLDRRDLRKVLRVSEAPILQLGGLGAFDEFGTYPVSVIRDGDKVVAYYGGWTRCESVPYNVAIGVAESFDEGVTFTRLGCGPLISFSLFEPMTISGPKIRKFDDRFYLFYVAGMRWIQGVERPESVFKIRGAESADGYHWRRFNLDLIENRLEEDECQASPDVIRLGDRFHMFFCYKYSFNFRNQERGYRIGYASSRNLIDWTRDDSKAGIDVSPEGWDSEMLAYTHVFALYGEVYMFYLGNGVGRNGFGLAKLEGVLD